jgi:hypothetical protein
MTLDEFRVKMDSFRRHADEEAKSLKDPYVTLERLTDLYQKSSDVERRMAGQILAEWTLSKDEGLRFDALALISDFKIVATLPALRELTARLPSCVRPSAPYDLKKVLRIIAELENIQ